MFRHGKRPLLFLLFACATGSASAAELAVEFGIESFRWREFEPAGRILEESGPRLRIGVNVRQPLDASGRQYLGLRGAFYFGEVDYDGQSQNLDTGARSPFQTDTNYLGLGGEVMLALRLGSSRVGEVFAGGGIDTWERDVQGRGNVGGALEDWTTFYAFAGGGAHWVRTEVRYQAQVGVKYPFYTYEAVDVFDVSVEPKGRLSTFGRLSADFMRGGRAWWGLGIHYDSYRFDMSNVARTGPLLIWQPESHQDTIGLYAMFYFN